MAGDLSKYTINNASETVKHVRHRHFTEAEFYRPMSQLYDEAIDYCSRKRLRTLGISMLTNGATHFITSMITEFPDKGPVTGEIIGLYYTLLALAFVVAGIILTALSFIFSKDPKRKEAMLKKYIDSEFTDDIDIPGAQAEFADGLIDGSKLTQNGSLKEHQFEEPQNKQHQTHPKHKHH